MKHEYFKVFILTFAFGCGLWAGFVAKSKLALLVSLLVFAVIQVFVAVIVKYTRKPIEKTLPQPETRYCLTCGKQLEGNNAKKFCCDRHRYSYRNKINPSHTYPLNNSDICLGCGKHFERLNGNIKKWCSEKCRWANKDKVRVKDIRNFRTLSGELRKKWNKEETNELIQLYSQNLTAKEIAKQISRNTNSVKTKIKCLRDKGILGYKNNSNLSYNQKGVKQ